MTRRIPILLLLLAIGPDGAAQTTPVSEGRVSPEGPYRSQVRLLDEGKATAEKTPEELLRGAQDTYGRALILRQLAQRGISAGDTATAIAYFEQALALDSLSPLAMAQMQINLGQLYALDGRHADAIRLLEAAATVDPFEEAEVSMTLANSYLQDNRPAEAARQAVAAIGQLKGETPAEWMRFVVYAFWSAGEPAAAARWQLRVIDTQPDEVAGWIGLAALYREAGDAARALATLQTAAMSGLLVASDDWLRLVGMHLDYGTPDLAVPWLERLATGSDDAQLWRWLGQTLLRTGDEPAALTALTTAARMDGAPAFWLEIGELAAALFDDDRAVEALRLASAAGAPGDVRGRALLLLGQLEAGRGRFAAAERAFRQAAEYGGVYRTATEWLDFLARTAPARSPQPEQAAGNEPDIVATPGPSAAQPAPTVTPATLAAVPAEGLAIKTVPALRVFTGSRATRAAGLTGTATKLVDELIRASRREKLEWTGPLHIVVTGDLRDETRDIDVRVAAPIRRVTPRRGDFGSGGLEAFRCTWRRYEGPLDGLAQAWRELYEQTIAAGLAPTGEARQVVLHRGGDRSDAIVELQIGIL